MADRPPAPNTCPSGAHAPAGAFTEASGFGPGRPERGPSRSGLLARTAIAEAGDPWRWRHGSH